MVPEIGSPAWDRELADIGVERADVERALKKALGGVPMQHVDPARIRFDTDSATTAAALVLLHETLSAYATLMELRVAAWFQGTPTLHAWVVRQYAAMLEHGSEAVKRSALYALWVDPFEVEEEARVVYPKLFELIGNDARAKLIANSGPAPWDAKLSSYEWAAALPAMHGALARGLSGSFFDVYGKVDVVGAARLFRQIEVLDAELRIPLTEATTSPLMLWIDHLYVTGDPKSFHIGVLVTSRSPRWIAGSELVVGNVSRGTLSQAMVTFDDDVPHTRIDAVGDPPAHVRDPQIVTLRFDGDAAAVQDLAGHEVALWPAGLREAFGKVPRPN